MKKPLKESKGPLKKVLGIFSLPIGIGTGIVSDAHTGHEVLECGHVMLPKEDIYGVYYAQKRRCRHCRDHKPPHIDVEDYKIGGAYERK